MKSPKKTNDPKKKNGFFKFYKIIIYFLIFKEEAKNKDIKGDKDTKKEIKKIDGK